MTIMIYQCPSKPENYQSDCNLRVNSCLQLCSIGSLGKQEKEDPVKSIHVRNCTLNGTTNGLRIKTWPGSTELEASDLTFEDVVMDRVSFPILIDQHYCPSKDCDNKVTTLFLITSFPLTLILD